MQFGPIKTLSPILIPLPEYITVHDAQGKEIRLIEDNMVLKDKLKQYQVPKKEFFSDHSASIK